MSHTAVAPDKLLNRVKRIRGQVEAIERSLTEGSSCADLLCLIASSRGAMNSLMAEVIEQLFGCGSATPVAARIQQIVFNMLLDDFRHQ